MSPDVKSPHRHIHDTVAPISPALDQSEQVQDKVKQAAADLSSVRIGHARNRSQVDHQLT